jgi:hypothetical protein
MPLIIIACVLVSHLAQPPAQPEQQDPAVLAKMEELGAVYLTRLVPQGQPRGVKGPIVGVDFRPMAGTDPKKIVEVVKEFSSLPELQTILLLGQDVTDEAADAIPASAKLTSIQFFNTKVTDNGMIKLNRFTSLNTFKYTGMGLSDVGMKDLAKIKTLQTIEITDSKITDEGVLALRTLPNLTRLTIENTAATQQAIDQLERQLPRVESRRFLR